MADFQQSLRIGTGAITVGPVFSISELATNEGRPRTCFGLGARNLLRKFGGTHVGDVVGGPGGGLVFLPRRQTSQPLRSTIIPPAGSEIVQHRRQAMATIRVQRGPKVGFSFGGLLGGIADVARGIGETLTGLPIGRRAPTTLGPGTIPPGNCPGGLVRIGNQCVDITAALPGGRPFLQPVGGTGVMPGVPRAPATRRPAGVDQFGAAVIGAFGQPAIEPAVFTDTSTMTGQRLKCPRGMALGRDDLCYSRQVLSKRSKFRKWRGAPSAPVSAFDLKVARKAESVAKELVRVGKMVDLKLAPKTSRRRAPAKSK